MLRVVPGALALLLLAVASVGCGGGDDDGGAADASPAATPGLAAKDLIPALEDLGWAVAVSARDPGAPAGQDVWKAQYRNAAAPEKSAIVTVYVYETPSVASAAMSQLSAAIANAPASAPGAPFISFGSPNVGEERAGFGSRSRDGRSNRVWSDLYREGRVVFWIQVVENDTASGATREQIAKRAVAMVPD